MAVSALNCFSISEEGSEKTLSVSLLIDLGILTVLLFSMVSGWKQGVVRGILNLVSTILALLIASRVGAELSIVAVEQVIRPATCEMVMARVEELSLHDLMISPMEEMEQVLNAIENEFVREEAQKILAGLGLSTESAEGMGKDALLAVSGEIVDTVLYGAVEEILSALFCLLAYLLLSVVFRRVAFAIGTIFELPLLRQANQLGGLAMGAVRGMILVLLAVWALRLFGLWITEETIEKSYLLPYLTSFLDSRNLTLQV